VNPTSGSGAQGTTTDGFGGPLDIQFTRDVAHAASKLDRQKANTIRKALLARFEDKIVAHSAPQGKTLQECSDLNTLRPTKLEAYNRLSS
jgi:hypothetical protein